MKIWDYLELAAKAARPNSRCLRNQYLGALAIRKDGAMVCSKNSSSIGTEPKVHAEYRVLQKAGWGSTLFVSRVRSNGLLALARPCGYCMAAIRAFGVTKVYYTISDDEYGCIQL